MSHLYDEEAAAGEAFCAARGKPKQKFRKSGGNCYAKRLLPLFQHLIFVRNGKKKKMSQTMRRAGA